MSHIVFQMLEWSVPDILSVAEGTPYNLAHRVTPYELPSDSRIKTTQYTGV